MTYKLIDLFCGAGGMSLGFIDPRFCGGFECVLAVDNDSDALATHHANFNGTVVCGNIEEWLEKLAPYRDDYRHHRTGETNGDAHLKNLLIGHQVLVPVTNGKLDLGPWQQVYYAEFDGRRRKRVVIKAIGD